jgi:hypothetical protein
MHIEDHQTLALEPLDQSVFSALLNMLRQKGIGVVREEQYVNTLYISPQTLHEISEVVRLCSRIHIPISVCYGKPEIVNSEPKVYLDLCFLDIFESRRENRYFIGLGTTVGQLRQHLSGAVWLELLSAAEEHQRLGQFLLSATPYLLEQVASLMAGLIAILPDGELWVSLPDEQTCATERLLNELFINQFRALLIVPIAIELQAEVAISNAAMTFNNSLMPDAVRSHSVEQIISKLKVALDPNRILNAVEIAASGSLPVEEQ